MTNFTRAEKIAVINVLFQLMNVDGKIDTEEVAYMIQLQIQLDFADDELIQAKGADVIESIQQIKDMSTDKKIHFLVMMREMMASDGNICNKEKELFAFIVILANLQEAMEKLNQLG